MIVYLAVFLIWLTALFTFGGLICKTLIRIPFSFCFESLLRNILVGYIVAITIGAVYFTGFKTIQILFVTIGVLILFELRRHNARARGPSPQVDSKKSVYVAVIASIIFFLINWLTVSNPSSSIKFFYGNGDYLLYSRIAESLTIDGNENGFNVLNRIDTYYNNPEPYHFFDLWGAAILCSITNLNVFPILITIIYPTFYLLVFLGLLALVNQFRIFASSITLALLFIGGLQIYPDGTYSFLKSLDNLSYNLLNPHVYKLSYFYVFFISAYLAFHKSTIQIAILILLGLPVANVITLPTIIPSIMMVILIGFHKKTLNRADLIACITYTAVYLSTYFIFYNFHQRESAGLAGAEITMPQRLVGDVFAYTNVKTQINIIVGGVLGIICLYWPYVVIQQLLGWTRPSPIPLMFISSAIAFSLLAWAILFNELNSSQIFSNAVIPLTNLIFCIGINNGLNDIRNGLYQKSTIIGFATLIGVLIFQFVNTFFQIKSVRYELHDQAYLSQVGEIIEKNSIIGCVRGIEDMKTIHSKYNAVYVPGDYLLLQKKRSIPVNINDLSTPIDSSSDLMIRRSIKAMRDGMFYRYSLRPEHQLLTTDLLMDKFIKQYDIKYLIVTKDAPLPTVILRRVKIKITDPLSGENFFILSEDCP